MQITIVQADIEQAIRNYIGSYLRVADHMEMTIELQATRGQDGFKAIIELAPAGTLQAKPVGAQVVPKATPAAAPQRVTAAQAVAMMEAEVEAETGEAPADGVETALETVTEAVEAAPFEGGTPVAEEPAAEPVETTAAAAEEPKPVRQNLFRGLKKPSNS